MSRNLKILVTGTAGNLPRHGFSSGIATRVLNHSRVLTQLGCEIHVFETFKQNWDFQDVPIRAHWVFNERSVIEIIPKFIVSFFILLIGQSRFTLSTVFQMFLLYSKRSFDYEILGISFAYVHALFKVVRSEHIDVIDHHGGNELAFLVCSVANFVKVPVVIEAYAEGITLNRKEKLLKNVFCDSSVRWVVAPSAYCLDGLKNYVGDSKKMAVVISGAFDNFVRFSRERARRILKIPQKLFVFLCVGRLYREKGPQYALEAFSMLCKNPANYYLIFVGSDGGMRDLLISMRKELKLSNRIHFAGTVSFEELMLYYSAADALVFPSVRTAECMGLPIKEAYFFDLPVIGFDIGGVPEAILDGKTGFVVHARDTKALASCMERVANNENLRVIFAHNIPIWRSRFSASKTGENLYKILHDATLS